MKPILLTLSFLLYLTASLAQTTPDTYVEVSTFTANSAVSPAKPSRAAPAKL